MIHIQDPESDCKYVQCNMNDTPTNLRNISKVWSHHTMMHIQDPETGQQCGNN